MGEAERAQAGEPEKSQRSTEYEGPSVTVDIILFTVRDQDLQVLLIRRKSPPFAGRWAIPGGFINMDESLEQSAQRELKEETGVTGEALEQVRAFGDPGRDPRGRTISVAYFALVPECELAQAQAGDDAGEIGWFSAYALPELAFDHAEILRCAVDKLRFKLKYTPIAARLLPPEFSMAALRKLYEMILGQKLDPAALRRRMLSMGLIEPVHGPGREQGRGPHNYRFRDTGTCSQSERA